MENESVLLKKVQKGDWSAFNLLFKSYFSPLYFYALAFLKDKEEAEDIVQETFLYLWENRQRIIGQGSLYAYLLQKIKHSCVNYKKHQEVKERYERLSQPEEIDEPYQDWEELREQVMAAMEKLPTQCRKIFTMGCIDGMKYREIADELGISVNTVKTQIKLAYQKLRDETQTANLLIILSLIQNSLP